ncbi:cell division protein FtsW (lipid II flippase) [Arthrobacter sp. SLBN-112]|nr:cell division protein FtsW (lipid II flippase) [Arthrobacter sp. SLBN-112]
MDRGQQQRGAARPARRRWGKLALWLEDDSPGRLRPLILAVVLTLSAIGLVEVASASSVESVAAGNNPYDLPLKQAMWTVAGVVIMLLLARMPVRRIRRLGWPMLIGSLIALVLVFTPLGMSVNGNRNWLSVGGFTAQPSEFAKLALIVWAAAILDRKQALLANWKHAVVPLGPAGGLIMIIVALGHDLGTTMIIMMILAATMFYGGVRMKVFSVAGIICMVAALVLAATSGNRMGRISSWLGMGSEEDAQGMGYQAQHGAYALASGGWFGVGLGQSRAEMELDPGSPQRLHLLYPGRRTRAGRNPPGPGPVRDPCHQRLQDHCPHYGHLLADRGLQCDHLDPGPGGDQHRHGERTTAGNRCPAALHFLWRLGHGLLPGRHRGDPGRDPAGTSRH